MASAEVAEKLAGAQERTTNIFTLPGERIFVQPFQKISNTRMAAEGAISLSSVQIILPSPEAVTDNWNQAASAESDLVAIAQSAGIFTWTHYTQFPIRIGAPQDAIVFHPIVTNHPKDPAIPTRLDYVTLYSNQHARVINYHASDAKSLASFLSPLAEDVARLIQTGIRLPDHERFTQFFLSASGRHIRLFLNDFEGTFLQPYTSTEAAFAAKRILTDGIAQLKYIVMSGTQANQTGARFENALTIQQLSRAQLQLEESICSQFS